MKKKLIALTLAAALPFAASAADGVSYNYVQAGYDAASIGNFDATGWKLEGSAAVHPNFHVFGDYSQLDIDDSPFDVDQWRLGVGYNHEISPKTDLLTRVAYEKKDFGSGFDFDGYSVEAGARANLLPQLNGYALAGYESIDSNGWLEDDSNFYGRFGAEYAFNQNWSVSGEIKLINGGDNEWTIGPRFVW